MIIKFDVFFTNHLNETKKITDKIVDFDNGLIDIEVNRLYAVASFVTNGVYYDTSIIGDGVERFEIKYKIDNNDVVAHKFVLDGVDYLKDNNIRIYLKTKGILKSYKYSGNISFEASSYSLKDILSTLLDGLAFDFTNLTDRELPYTYKSDKSPAEIIEDLREVFGFEYYYKDGIIYFEDKKDLTYKKEVRKFSEVKDILSFSTSVNKEDKKINEVVINKKTQTKTENKIKLLIDPSPQPCSPSDVLVYIDDGNSYKIPPKYAIFNIFTTHKDMIDNLQINISDKNITYTKNQEKVLIEEYELNDENCFFVTAFINELIGYEIDDDIKLNYENNLVKLNKKYTGIVKISYKTIAFIGQIPPFQYPKTIFFNITAQKEKLTYNHKLELNGYYPIPYNLTISLIKDWGIDYENAINKEIIISKYDKDNDTFVKKTTTSSNEVGEFEFNITKYGIYRFDTPNQEPLFLYYFVNKFEFCMDEKE